jgi:uncharacterized membrane protein YphA (DoxX/SURF4 family)
MNAQTRYLPTLGRLLIAAIFIISGVGKNGNRSVTASLDGEIRDGRHKMQVRVYF